MEESSKNHAKFYLKAHIVLVSKYRRNIFVKNFDKILISYINSLSLNYDFKINNINTDLNHIHMLISYEPKVSISSIIRCIKQNSTKYLWNNYTNYLRKFYYKKNVIWSSGYYVSSIGDIDENKINNYISNQ